MQFLLLNQPYQDMAMKTIDVHQLFLFDSVISNRAKLWYLQSLLQVQKCSFSANNNYSQPLTHMQKHLNDFQQQLNMRGTDLKEQFSLVWATEVIRVYYSVQTQGHCCPFKMTCCPVKPRRGPAQHWIAFNGISQH